MKKSNFDKDNFAVLNLFSRRNSRAYRQDVTTEEFFMWKALINYINSIAIQQGELQRNGTDSGCWYGVCQGNTFGASYRPEESTEVTLLDAFNELGLEIDRKELESVVLVAPDWELVLKEDCVPTSDRSHYAGRMIRKLHAEHISIAYADYYRERLGISTDDVFHSSEIGEDYYDNKFLLCDSNELNLRWSDYNSCYVSTYGDDRVCYGIISSYGDEGYFISDEYVTAYDTDEIFADGDIADSCGCWYNEDDGEWYRRRPRYNADYHSLGRKTTNCFSNAVWRIGFEIEKEDEDAMQSYPYQELYNNTHWIKENDGSLGCGGYELISPTMDLFSTYLDNMLSDYSSLRSLINADYGIDSCGGHINLSSTQYNRHQLFEGMSGFLPLLYAMYQNRMEESYCKAKSKHRYYDGEKYSAVYLRDTHLEFRIFPAVRNVNNLLWRRDLIRIMCENINADEMTVLKMMVNTKSKLYKHLRKVFTQEKIIDKVSLFLTYSGDLNNKKITPSKSFLKKFDELKKKKDNINPSGSTDQLGA